MNAPNIGKINSAKLGQSWYNAAYIDSALSGHTGIPSGGSAGQYLKSTGDGGVAWDGILQQAANLSAATTASAANPGRIYYVNA